MRRARDAFLAVLAVSLGVAPAQEPDARARQAGAPLVAGATPVAAGSSVIETIMRHPELTLFRLLLEDAGLLDDLGQPEGITVFAPTDGAIARLDRLLLMTLMNDPQVLRKVLLFHVAQDRHTYSALAGRLAATSDGGGATTGTGGADAGSDAGGEGPAGAVDRGEELERLLESLRPEAFVRLSSAMGSALEVGPSSAAYRSGRAGATGDRGEARLFVGNVPIVETDLLAEDGVVHLIDGVLIPLLPQGFSPR